ncbi:MAG TPA: hypothetical protein PKA63_09025 [Oligoflexia bacterium]|nr:hypothetical protein [Oligoflexia bacterium]HMP48794.1 hypothetical protein [Oligoflexia bacterium]
MSYNSGHSTHDFRKAAEALVDAATYGIGCSGNVRLHPSIREFLVEEMIECPNRAIDLFRENFIENFLSEIIKEGINQ